MAGKDLGLLGGDVSGAADAMREVPMAAGDEGRGDTALPLPDARAPPEVVAVHERQVLRGSDWSAQQGWPTELLRYQIGLKLWKGGSSDWAGRPALLLTLVKCES